MFYEKLKWAYRLLRSRTYVILTDKSSVVSIPLVNIEAMENQFLLAGQTASLQEFRSRLEDLIGEHEQAIALLARRQGDKQVYRKRTQPAPKPRNKVRKTTKTRKP